MPDTFTIHRRKDSQQVTMKGPTEHGLGDGREFDNVRLAAEHALECGKNSGSAVVRLMTHDNFLESERPIPQDNPPTLHGGSTRPATYF